MTEMTPERLRTAIQQGWHEDMLFAAVSAWEADRKYIKALEKERDLAIAHDTQPYPTVAAYETVCAARTKWQERAEALERIKRAAARLRCIPAVQQILGTNHTSSCCCALCETNAALAAEEKLSELTQHTEQTDERR